MPKGNQLSNELTDEEKAAGNEMKTLYDEMSKEDKEEAQSTHDNFIDNFNNPQKATNEETRNIHGDMSKDEIEIIQELYGDKSKKETEKDEDEYDNAVKDFMKDYEDAKDPNRKKREITILSSKKRFPIEKYMEINEDGKPTKVYLNKFAQALIWKYQFKTIRDSSLHGDTILYYKNGCYRYGAESIIDKEAQDVFGGLLTKRSRLEIAHYIRASTYIERSQLNSIPYMITLKNGIYNTKTRELLNHTHKHLSTVMINAEYNPDAKCPERLKFLRAITGNDEEKMTNLIEYGGFCLYPEYFIKTALALVGPRGDNGKTVYQNMVRDLVGQENCSTVSLHEFDKNFVISRFFGKLVNTFADLSSKDLEDTSVFKMLTGNDPIQGEYKFGKQFDFTNHAKLIFSTNKLSKSSFDDTDAYFKRWNIVECLYTFVDNPDPNNEFEKQKINGLEEKLNTPEEKSGFLNLALEALGSLLDTGKFTFEKTSSEKRHDYKRQSDPVYAFFSDWCEADENSKIRKSELYEVYLRYCKIHKLGLTLKKNTFGKHLHGIDGLDIFRAKVTIDKEQKEAWGGITFSKKYYEDLPGMKDFNEDVGVTVDGKDPLESLLNTETKKEQNLSDLSELVTEEKPVKGEVPNNGNGRKNKDFLHGLQILSDQNSAINISVLKQEAKTKEISVEELCRIRYVGTYTEVMECMK